MINSFRSFFQSKLGLGLTLAFLGLIALAFASMDVSSSGSFGGLSGTNNVAVVGKEHVTTAELRQSAQNAFGQVQQNEPTLSLEQFLNDGGLEQVFDTLLDRVTVSEFGRLLGLRAGENLINSEIRMIPAFAGADGNFSEDAYRAAISSQGLTDKIVREDLTNGLIARQVLIPAVFGAKFPDSIVRRYAQQLREQREGSIALLPSEAFIPKEDPTDKQLQAFYRANKEDFRQPERRVIRYAVFGTDAIGDRAKPTPAEIRKRYQDNADSYRASEERTFTQLIVPTRQAAESFRDSVSQGASLSSVAREAGLEAAQIGPIRQEDYAQQVNSGVATAVFAAKDGTVAKIARSPLGFHVVRIDDVTPIPARTLEQARTEIEESLRQEKQRRALSELASEIEDRVNTGESFREVAEALDLKIQTTEPLIASGAVFGGNQEDRAPAEVEPLVATAFQMEEGQPQIAQVDANQTFVMYETASVTPSTTPPLSEVRDAVSARWMIAQGAKEARAAADRILKRIADGSSLADAMRAEDTRLPPASPIRATREQLLQQQRPNPPVTLMFAMTKGSAKRLEAPQDAGYFLVSLDKITAGKIEDNDPLIAQAAEGYGSILSREYGDQLRVAVRSEVGVERNDEAVEAVRRQLTGAGN